MAFCASAQAAFALRAWQLARLAYSLKRDLIVKGAAGLAGVIRIEDEPRAARGAGGRVARTGCAVRVAVEALSDSLVVDLDTLLADRRAGELDGVVAHVRKAGHAFVREVLACLAAGVAV